MYAGNNKDEIQFFKPKFLCLGMMANTHTLGNHLEKWPICENLEG